MMTSRHRNAFHLLVLCEGNPPISGGFPSQRVSNAEFWCFLWCQPEEAFEKTIRLAMIWDAILHDLRRSCDVIYLHSMMSRVVVMTVVTTLLATHSYVPWSSFTRFTIVRLPSLRNTRVSGGNVPSAWKEKKIPVHLYIFLSSQLTQRDLRKMTMTLLAAV